jgi:hypothetical protein
MRLWSINPMYLDSIGLVALWRESLLAKKVLQGKTIGYKQHPQLERFKNQKKDNSIKLIENYLFYIYLESKKRGFNFDKTKCRNHNLKKRINVNSGQLEFEVKHLQKKLVKRNKKKFVENKKLLTDENILANNLFKIIPGEIESWEKI